MVVIVIVEAFDRGLLDGSVHPLHLAIGPGMVELGEPVLDAVLGADPIEDMVESVFVAGPVGELDAVAGQHRVDGVGNRRDQVPQELGRDHLARILVEFGIGELGCPVDGHEQTQLAFGCLNFGDVDVEEADRVALELLLGRLVAYDLRKPADLVTLQAAMQ